MPVRKALERFYGIGSGTAQRIMARYYIYPRALMRDLNTKQPLELTAELGRMTIENELRQQMRDNILRLRNMKSYRGMRHAFGLPVRGQRTRGQIATAAKLNRLDRKG